MSTTTPKPYLWPFAACTAITLGIIYERALTITRTRRALPNVATWGSLPLPGRGPRRFSGMARNGRVTEGRKNRGAYMGKKIAQDHRPNRGRRARRSAKANTQEGTSKRETSHFKESGSSEDSATQNDYYLILTRDHVRRIFAECAEHFDSSALDQSILVTFARSRDGILRLTYSVRYPLCKSSLYSSLVEAIAHEKLSTLCAS